MEAASLEPIRGCMIRTMTTRSTAARLAAWVCPPPYVPNPSMENGLRDEIFSEWTEPEIDGRVTAKEESLRFKQMHYCAYVMTKIYRSVRKGYRKNTPELLTDYNEWYRRYETIRTRLVNANMGLVYSQMRRRLERGSNVDRNELESAGLHTLLLAVDTFDPWRGFRFSTYACNAIIRAFLRACCKQSKLHQRELLVAEPDDEDARPTEVDSRKDEEEVRFVFARLKKIMDISDLTPQERLVLSRRFPAADKRGRKNKQSLDKIGIWMDLSKERIRQIQMKALRKLRLSCLHDPILRGYFERIA